MTRNNDKKIIVLKNDSQYASILKNRNAEKVSLHETETIVSPDDVIDDEGVYEDTELWRPGTKLWSLAEKHYGDGRHYWIIGLHNDKPTDGHWLPGDVAYIPKPLQYVMSIMES